MNAVASATMAAGIVAAPGSARLARVPVPEPAAGEVLVRLAGCGVCGSNVPVWEGRAWQEYPLPPGAPGHEGWGVVEALGPDVDGPQRGTPVAVLSQRAFAEYDVAPAGAVVPLPTELEGGPFPGEALACALNVMRRSGVARGALVGVVGVGFLGAQLVRLCTAAGARVVAVSRRAFALEVARGQGAAEALPLEDASAFEEACDVAIEAAGVQETLDVAGRLTRARGRLVIAGYHQDGPRQVNMQLWNWRGLDVVNAHERDPRAYVRGLRDAVEAARDGTIDVGALVTHTFPLERLGDALEAARARPEGFLKAVVVT